jgi:DNA-binding IclR family transcriptional regulator
VTAAAPGAARPAVPAVARAARMLEELSATPGGMTLSELARTIGAPKSSCLAVCTTLVESGLLAKSPSGAYQLGWKVVPLGRSYLAQSNLVTEFRRVDQELNPLPDDTIVLSLLDGRTVVYVETRPGLRPVAMHYEIGLRLPAHCTASGKALLAALPDDEIAGRYAEERFDGLTSHSITCRAELAAELERTRERGYAIDDQETALGMICVGAAIVGASGQPAGALSVSMVKATVDADRIGHAAESMLRLTRALAARLGTL